MTVPPETAEPVANASESRRSPEVFWHHGQLDRQARWGSLGQSGATVWFTGLSGSGKSTLASALEADLIRRGRLAYLLDGDNLRHGLNGDLGFTAEDREENVRRVGEVARLFADAGAVALVALVSPYRSGRDFVRRLHQAAGLDFFEVFIDAPLSVCQERDPKGLYRRAASGEVPGLTGVAAPYEPPEAPDLVVDTTNVGIEDGVRRVRLLLAR